MMDFIINNAATIAISLIIFALAALDVIYLYKRKKGSACGQGCSGCPHGQGCGR